MLATQTKALAFAIVSLSTAALLGADAPLQTTRSVVEKLVEARKLISEEKNAWRQEQVVLSDIAAAYQRELEALEEQIANIGDNRTQANKEREEVELKKAQLRAASDTMKERVVGFESKIRDLSKSLPAPLVDTLDRLVRQLPEDSTNTEKSISSRMLVVVGILTEIDKFNNRVEVASELRADASGNEMQVQVLYLGLGQAYFVDRTGAFAGVGIPSPDGWKWEDRPGLAPTISKAIAIYENTEPAVFVDLPVVLK